MSAGSDSISCVMNPLGLLIFLPSKNKKLIIWLLPVLTNNGPKSRFMSHHNMGSVNTKEREAAKQQKLLDERHWMLVRNRIKQQQRESEAKKRNQMVRDMKEERKHGREADTIARRECLSHAHHHKTHVKESGRNQRSRTLVQPKSVKKESSDRKIK